MDLRPGTLIALGARPVDARAAAATHTLILKNGRWSRHSVGTEYRLDCSGVYSVAGNHVAFIGDPLPDCNHAAGNRLSATWTMRGGDLAFDDLGGVEAAGFDRLVCCTNPWHRVADPPSGTELRQ
jgi:hypothetical protein